MPEHSETVRLKLDSGGIVGGICSGANPLAGLLETAHLLHPTHMERLAAGAHQFNAVMELRAATWEPHDWSDYR